MYHQYVSKSARTLPIDKSTIKGMESFLRGDEVKWILFCTSLGLDALCLFRSYMLGWRRIHFTALDKEEEYMVLKAVFTSCI